MVFFIKKILIIFSIIIMVLAVNKKNKDYVVIPDSAIRLRIISNSDNSNDISLKLKLKAYLEDYLYNLVSKAQSYEDANNILKNNLEVIKKETSKFLGNNNFKVEYGLNYFPSKTYKGVIYNGGYYQSLVISLGSARGSNWWCVLFPPLCLMEDNDTTDDVEYKFFIKRIIDNFK